jgi:hypothetical protein
MIDEDVLRRTGVDIRGKSFMNGETFGVRVPVSGYMRVKSAECWKFWFGSHRSRALP